MQYDRPWERTIHQGQMSLKDLQPAEPFSDPDPFNFLIVKIERDHLQYFPRSSSLLGLGVDVNHHETVPTQTPQKGSQIPNLLDYMGPQSIFVNIIYILFPLFREGLGNRASVTSLVAKMVKASAYNVEDPWVGKIPWRRKWQPTPVFLPGKSHGWMSLAGYSPWGCKESDTTEQLHYLSFSLWTKSRTCHLTAFWSQAGYFTSWALLSSSIKQSKLRYTQQVIVKIKYGNTWEDTFTDFGI